MRLSTRMIATAAFAVVLVLTLNVSAGEAVRSSSGAASDKGDDSGSASNEAASLPAAPVPEESRVASPGARGPHHHNSPKAELFLGYSYLRAVPTLAEGNRMMWLNGGSANIAVNFNRYLGVVGDFGVFKDSELRFSTSSPATVADSNGNLYTYLFGPRLSFRNQSRFTPFAQALFGIAHASEVTLSGCTGDACTLLPTENKFAMTAGGGLDIRVHHGFAIRLVQVEYMMTRFANLDTGNSASQNDMRLSSGIVFRFGGAPHLPPLPPLAYSCSVTPSSAYAGDDLAASGTALNLNPAKTATYSWSASGGTVSGTSDSAHIDTTNAAPGAYTLSGHVSEGDKPEEGADCSASYQVKANEPPTIGCSANPSTVTQDGSSTITATGVSPQNRALTYSFDTSAGSISGSGATATLSTAGVPSGDITVTCKVADDKGQSASASTPVTVAAPVAAPKPMTSNLCSVQFDRDLRRPARVNNEGKACLDEVALNLQHSSDAKLALVGNAASKAKGSRKLAAERAANSKAYLVEEKGIDASRVAPFTGSEESDKVSIILMPSGATLDSTGNIPVDESTTPSHPAATRKRGSSSPR
jgi:opacity protein-like surface antigen